MNTKPLESFCPWARTQLIADVRQRCIAYHLDDAGRAQYPMGATFEDPGNQNGELIDEPTRRQRDTLYQAIEREGYGPFTERVAYTWFNRLIAIRFMEVNGYLSSRIRMLSSVDGSFDPECLKAVGELDLPGLDRVEALALVAAGAYASEKLYRKILIAQCIELAQAMPDVFDKIQDGDALLLPDNLLAKEEHNVLYRLVTDIPEVDAEGNEPWKRIEILGWMYQFYNAEVKREFFDSKRKAAPEDLAPATQLFTPEWIVRYMVDNSLGRLWMLNHPDSQLLNYRTVEDPDDRLMEYYIEPDDAHEDFIRIAKPEDITFCDPACGSGHILVYAFRMLYAIYLECGYRPREIPQLILEHNLSGMEIDQRAAQIAQLALVLSARKYDRRFLTRNVHVDVEVIESVGIDPSELPADCALVKTKGLLDTFAHLSEVGSLYDPTEDEMAAVDAALGAVTGTDVLSDNLRKRLERVRTQCALLSRHFDMVVANPPYMGSKRFSPFMSKWMEKHYTDVKSDLFSSFIIRNMNFAKDHGEIGMMSPFVWMFIGSYEKLRNKLIDEKTITSLVQLEYSGFADATVPICTFTFHNAHIPNYKGGYVRLSDFVGSGVQGPKALEAIQNPDCGWFYRTDATTFHDIPGSPIAYWASPGTRTAFLNGVPLSKVAKPRIGAQASRELFFRRWWEVGHAGIGLNSKSVPDSIASKAQWVPCNKGDGYRKWFGNRDWIIFWRDGGREIAKHPSCTLSGLDYYFKEGVTWGLVSSGPLSARISPLGTIFTNPGPMCTGGSHQINLYTLALLNTSLARFMLGFITPTINCSSGDLGSLPVVTQGNGLSGETIEGLAESNIRLSKLDWNSRETSLEFMRNPLI